MTSKISYFDRAIFRCAVKKAAPLCALYTLAWLLFLPFSLPSVYAQALRATSFTPAYELAHRLLSNTGAIAGVFSLLYGLALAWLLYLWLFRTSSACYHASLPVRREALFLTNYLTGLLAFLAPHALIALVTFCVTAALGCPLLSCCLQWFAVISLYCLFFFSFAVLLVMIVGQMAAMPLVYCILNLAVYLVYHIVSGLMNTFVYGMPHISSSLDDIFILFSPVLAIVAGQGPAVASDAIFNEALGYYESGMPYLIHTWYALALGAAGLVFALLGFQLLKKREMERCGDVIAVRPLRPVFLYAFTIGCALVIGQFIMHIISDGAASGNFILVMLFLFIGAFLGHFAAQMMLQKTVRVFKTGWPGLGACCLALLVLFGAARLDITRYSRRIPAAGDIDSVSIDTGYYAPTAYAVTDADAIAAVLRMHENILSCRTEQQRLASSTEPTISRDVTISYNLKNGTTLTRYYQLYVPEAQPDEDNPLVQFANVYNSLPFVQKRQLPGFAVTRSSVATCRIEGRLADEGGAYDGRNLSSDDAYTFYTDCILPDLEDSSLGRSSFGALNSTAEAVEDGDAFNYSPCHVEFTFITPDGGETSSYFTIPLDAKRTAAYLEELGFDLSWSET